MESEKQILDPDGDLTLVVGSPQSVEFVISSKALAHVSPIFRGMLRSPWAESQRPQGEEWKVCIPYDSPTVFTILLNILHLHFDNVPERLLSHELFNLVVATHKYDMTEILTPWAWKWTTCLVMPVTVHNLINCVNTHTIDDLVIAWELGSKDLFEVALRDIILTCSVNSNGELLQPNLTGDRVEDAVFTLPRELPQDVKDLRQQVLVELVILLQHVVHLTKRNQYTITINDRCREFLDFVEAIPNGVDTDAFFLDRKCDIPCNCSVSRLLHGLATIQIQDSGLRINLPV